ncbi:MAG: formate dehydrogenase accessory sulfurtransferase FdhD, partial [Candidatus Helarchaeota archaeon]
FPMIKSDINIDQNLINIIFKSQKKLQDLAEIWRKTGGTHQAAVFKLSGDLVAFAEDCGRHNAMDKVIGKTYLQKINPNKCFLITTGRLSFGMVSKVIRAMFLLFLVESN